MVTADQIPLAEYDTFENKGRSPSGGKDLLRLEAAFKMGEFQPFPSCRYHYNGETTVVKNPEEDAALGGGWARNPTAFDPYKGPRRLGPQHDPVKWADQWPVDGLSEGDRRTIKARLKRSHSAFWRLPDDPNADIKAMRLAFDGVAQVLFAAGLLTEQFLANDIPRLVWDAAIAGGWWRLASETRQDMFPDQLGHYWVWRDDSRDWNLLFTAEASEWQAALLDVGAEETVHSDRSKGSGHQLGAEGIAGSLPADWTGGPDRNSESDAGHEQLKNAQAQTRRRLSSCVTSHVAARRLEEYVERNNIGLTEFATKVGTTDTTLRRFRRTGRVRRALLDAIASEMGTTRESIVKP
jgi:hypothetical protein